MTHRCTWEWLKRGKIVQCRKRANQGGVACDQHCRSIVRMFKRRERERKESA